MDPFDDAMDPVCRRAFPAAGISGTTGAQRGGQGGGQGDRARHGQPGRPRGGVMTAPAWPPGEISRGRMKNSRFVCASSTRVLPKNALEDRDLAEDGHAVARLRFRGREQPADDDGGAVADVDRRGRLAHRDDRRGRDRRARDDAATSRSRFRPWSSPTSARCHARRATGTTMSLTPTWPELGRDRDGRPDDVLLEDRDVLAGQEFGLETVQHGDPRRAQDVGLREHLHRLRS